MKSLLKGRLLEGGDGDDYLKGTRKDDVIYGHAGDDVIVAGSGVDIMYGGEDADVFVFDDKDAGDVSFGRADTIGDLSAEDIIDISNTEVLFFAGFGTVEPARGGFSIWAAQGNTYVTWNTFGEMHDVKLTGFVGDPNILLQQIRWYEDDYAGSLATDASIAPGETITGTLEVDVDQDWFRIDIEQGLLYTFDLQGQAQGGGTLVDPYLELLDESGNFVTFGYEEIVFLAGATGTYFLKALTFGGSGSYTLEVAAEPYIDDFGDNIETIGEIAPGETVNGVINAHFDQDWFRIEVEEGLLYTFDMQGQAQGGGTVIDPYLELFDVFGNFVASGYEELTFLAEAPGTYFISARTFGDTGSYTLEVAAEPYADDFGNDMTTGGAIAPGETVNGNIGLQFDEDWFRVELAAGETYTIDLRGQFTGAGSLPDPYLRLLDGHGHELAFNNDTDGPDSQIVYDAALAGTYFIAAGELGGQTGTYELSVSEAIA